MPFKSEHAARQLEPGHFARFRRFQPSGFPAGLEVILGIPEGGGSEIQCVRANASLWTVERFKAWLRKHEFRTSVEPAKGSKASKTKGRETMTKKRAKKTKIKKLMPVTGYAYELDSSIDKARQAKWDSLPDNLWEINFYQPTGREKLLGSRFIDGAEVFVFRANGTLIAQSAVNVRAGK